MVLPKSHTIWKVASKYHFKSHHLLPSWSSYSKQYYKIELQVLGQGVCARNSCPQWTMNHRIHSQIHLTTTMKLQQEHQEQPFEEREHGLWREEIEGMEQIVQVYHIESPHNRRSINRWIWSTPKEHTKEITNTASRKQPKAYETIAIAKVLGRGRPR